MSDDNTPSPQRLIAVLEEAATTLEKEIIDIVAEANARSEIVKQMDAMFLIKGGPHEETWLEMKKRSRFGVMPVELIFTGDSNPDAVPIKNYHVASSVEYSKIVSDPDYFHTFSVRAYEDFDDIISDRTITLPCATCGSKDIPLDEFGWPMYKNRNAGFKFDDDRYRGGMALTLTIEIFCSHVCSRKQRKVAKNLNKLLEGTPEAIVSHARCYYPECNEYSTKLLLCGRCKVARYCGTEHQRLDWATHKKECSHS